MTILSDVKALGQQIWLDNLSRSLVQSGELAEMLQKGVCGVTSNPAIFQKAFAGDKLYADEIAALKQQNLTPKQRYETLAIADVQAACDVCLPEFAQSDGKTGFVSLEVAPDLSHDAAGTVAEAKRLHAAINRPNVMIKVPTTDAGVAALEQLVSDGISINLTLLFSRKQTLKAYEAYVKGIEGRLKAGKQVNHIQVVASFFISRIDNALDATLPEHLQGKTAIALAKAAYQDWQAFFGGERFAALKAQGANPVQVRDPSPHPPRHQQNASSPYHPRQHQPCHQRTTLTSWSNTPPCRSKQPQHALVFEQPAPHPGVLPVGPRQ